MPQRDERRLIVGVMTGTSIDAMDVAVVGTTGRGLDLRVESVRHAAHDLGPLRNELRRAADQAPMTAADFATLAWRFGELHADAVARTLEDGETPDLVAAHGQTIAHAPPTSWQLINAAPIARRLGCRVVTDLRQADLAAGGQGAPITPVADWILFADEDRRRAIVNLGGFCNTSILPRRDEADPIGRIAGFDVCACNHLLDAVARIALGADCDMDGRAARTGAADVDRAGRLADTLAAQANAGRSLGTGDELTAWVIEHAKTLTPPDLAATAVRAIAAALARRLEREPVDQVVLAGGGVMNVALRTAIDAAIAADVIASDALGVDVSAREAVAMAILGALSADGVAIGLPAVTGATPPATVAGLWTSPPTS